METCKVFSIQDGNYLAIAEFSKISYIEVFEFLDGLVMDKLSDRLPKKNWFFFNRLSVPIPIRRRGHANNLMSQVVEWADSGKLNIINPINAYGDLDAEQLNLYYKKYKFVEVDKGIMIRIT